MTPEQKLTLMRPIVVVGFAISLLHHVAMGELLDLGYPYNTFLFRPGDRFMDLYNAIGLSPDPYGKVAAIRNYPPLFYLLMRPFTTIPHGMILPVFFALPLIFFVSYSWHCLSKYRYVLFNIAIFVVCSYPIWFSFDRANHEIYVFMCLAAFVACFAHERYLMCDILLAVALNLKPFPIIFLALYLARRQYKHALYCLLLTLLIGITSLWLLGGDFWMHLSNLRSSLALYQLGWVVGNEGLYFGNSLYGMLKALGTLCMPALFWEQAPAWFTSLYGLGAVLAFVWITYKLMHMRLEFWEQVTILVMCMNLLPFASGDYKLLHIYIPLFLFLRLQRSSPYDRLYVLLFAFLLVPKNIGHFGYIGSNGYAELGAGTVLNPAAMLILLVLALRDSAHKKVSQSL